MAEHLISTAEPAMLPDSYVRPETQRPRLDEVVPDAEIPVVDLADPDRAAVVDRVAEACRNHGFFQVLNHGVPEELTAAMLSVAYEFFRLPAEEKAKLYSDDPGKKMRLSTSFNVRKETVHNWRDYLRPDKPPSLRTYDLEAGGQAHREEEEAKMLRDILAQIFSAILPMFAMSYSAFKDAPEYVKLINFGGLLFIYIVLIAGMLSRSLGRREWSFRLLSCSAVTLLTFSVTSQLSAPTYIVLTALIGGLVNLGIMLLRFR